MNRWSGRVFPLLAACCLLGGLGADGCGEDTASVPVADAGDDITIELGQQAQLDGTGSTDPGGGTLVFHWTIESKPVSSVITDDLLPQNHESGGSKTSFIPDVPGTYGVSLYVENGEGVLSDLDYVAIVAGSTNNLPVADGGDDIAVAVGEVAYLDGSASSDPEGAELSYEWSFDLVPTDSALGEGDLYNQGAPEAAIIPDVPGQFVVRLRVYDGEFWSAPDFVTVSATNDNEPPIADAGDSWELTPCSSDTIQLDGGASYDYEGADLEYTWEIVSVPTGSAVTTASLDDPAAVAPSFDWDEVGLYTARLVVSDGELDSTPDYVAVRTTPHVPNSGPVADAGDNIEVQQTSLYYNNQCSTCVGQQIILDASWSEDPDHDPLTYTWTILSDTEQGESDEAVINGEHAEQAELQLSNLEPSGNGDIVIQVVTIELAVEDCQGEVLGSTDQIVVSFYCECESF